MRNSIPDMLHARKVKTRTVAKCNIDDATRCRLLVCIANSGALSFFGGWRFARGGREGVGTEFKDVCVGGEQSVVRVTVFFCVINATTSPTYKGIRRPPQTSNAQRKHVLLYFIRQADRWYEVEAPRTSLAIGVSYK